LTQPRSSYVSMMQPVAPPALSPIRARMERQPPPVLSRFGRKLRNQTPFEHLVIDTSQAQRYSPPASRACSTRSPADATQLGATVTDLLYHAMPFLRVTAPASPAPAVSAEMQQVFTFSPWGERADTHTKPQRRSQNFFAFGRLSDYWMEGISTISKALPATLEGHFAHRSYQQLLQHAGGVSLGRFWT